MKINIRAAVAAFLILLGFTAQGGSLIAQVVQPPSAIDSKKSGTIFVRPDIYAVDARREATIRHFDGTEEYVVVRAFGNDPTLARFNLITVNGEVVALPSQGYFDGFPKFNTIASNIIAIRYHYLSVYLFEANAKGEWIRYVGYGSSYHQIFTQGVDRLSVDYYPASEYRFLEQGLSYPGQQLRLYTQAAVFGYDSSSGGFNVYLDPLNEDQTFRIVDLASGVTIRAGTFLPNGELEEKVDPATGQFAGGAIQMVMRSGGNNYFYVWYEGQTADKMATINGVSRPAKVFFINLLDGVPADQMAAYVDATYDGQTVTGHLYVTTVLKANGQYYTYELGAANAQQGRIQIQQLVGYERLVFTYVPDVGHENDKVSFAFTRQASNGSGGPVGRPAKP